MRRTSAAAAALSALLIAAGCGGGDAESGQDPSQEPTTPPAAAEPPPAPPEQACYRLSFDQALSPTSAAKQHPCRGNHTSESYRVGRLELMVDGHLVAVDSDQAQQQVAQACPAALPRFVGADQETLRLSMIRAVWFTPTLEESDRGADWYRCDAVVVAGNSELVQLTGSLRGALAGEGGHDRFAMCGTAAPDDAKFERVACVAQHSWRAVSTVPFDVGAKYPGDEAVRVAGDGCEDVALDHIDDPLAKWGWAYEWPTLQQWQDGMTFGRCWVTE